MIKQFFITIAGSGGQFLISIIGSILAARLLGVEARGELAAIQLLPTILISIAALGTPQALTYYTARQPQDAGRLLGSSLAIATVGVILTVIIGWAVTPHMLNNYREEVINAGLIYLLIIPLATIYGIPWSSFLGLKKYLNFNILKLLPNIAYLIAILFAFFYPDPSKVAYINLITICILVIPSVWVTYLLKVGLPIKIQLSNIQKISRYSLISFLTALPPIIGQRIEYFFILMQLDAYSMGIYAVASVAGQSLLTVINSFGDILFPNLAGDKEEGGSSLFFSRLIRLSILALLIITTPLLISLPWLLKMMYGEGFSNAIMPASILIISYGLTGINKVIGDGFRGKNLPELLLWTELFSFLLKLSILLLIDKDLTLIWAAASSLVGTLGVLVINIFLYNKFIEELKIEWLKGFLYDINIVLRLIKGKLA